MIEHLSEKIANKLKSINPDETSSIEVMKFGLAMTLNLTLTVAASLLIGYITNHVKDVIVTILTFTIIRRFSGGYHARNLTICFIYSTALFTIIPLINLSDAVLFILNSISLIIISLCAPTFNLKGKIYLYKIISILFVLASLSIDNASISLAVFAQSLFLIPSYLERG